MDATSGSEWTAAASAMDSVNSLLGQIHAQLDLLCSPPAARRAAPVACSDGGAVALPPAHQAAHVRSQQQWQATPGAEHAQQHGDASAAAAEAAPAAPVLPPLQQAPAQQQDTQPQQCSHQQQQVQQQLRDTRMPVLQEQRQEQPQQEQRQQQQQQQQPQQQLQPVLLQSAPAAAAAPGSAQQQQPERLLRDSIGSILAAAGASPSQSQPQQQQQQQKELGSQLTRSRSNSGSAAPAGGLPAFKQSCHQQQQQQQQSSQRLQESTSQQVLVVPSAAAADAAAADTVLGARRASWASLDVVHATGFDQSPDRGAAAAPAVAAAAAAASSTAVAAVAAGSTGADKAWGPLNPAPHPSCVTPSKAAAAAVARDRSPKRPRNPATVVGCTDQVTRRVVARTTTTGQLAAAAAAAGAVAVSAAAGRSGGLVGVLQDIRHVWSPLHSAEVQRKHDQQLRRELQQAQQQQMQPAAALGYYSPQDARSAEGHTPAALLLPSCVSPVRPPAAAAAAGAQLSPLGRAAQRLKHRHGIRAPDTSAAAAAAETPQLPAACVAAEAAGGRAACGGGLQTAAADGGSSGGGSRMAGSSGSCLQQRDGQVDSSSSYCCSSSSSCGASGSRGVRPAAATHAHQTTACEQVHCQALHVARVTGLPHLPQQQQQQTCQSKRHAASNAVRRLSRNTGKQLRLLPCLARHLAPAYVDGDSATNDSSDNDSGRSGSDSSCDAHRLQRSRQGVCSRTANGSRVRGQQLSGHPPQTASAAAASAQGGAQPHTYRSRRIQPSPPAAPAAPAAAAAARPGFEAGGSPAVTRTGAPGIINSSGSSSSGPRFSPWALERARQLGLARRAPADSSSSSSSRKQQQAAAAATAACVRKLLLVPSPRKFTADSSSSSESESDSGRAE